MTRQRKQLHQLETFDEVVTALGGERAVARLCDDQDSSAVCNWRRLRNRFPTKFWPVMADALAEAGFCAPVSLWGFYEPTKQQRAAWREEQQKRMTVDAA